MGNESIFHSAADNWPQLAVWCPRRLNYVNFVIFDTDLQAQRLLKIFALDRPVFSIRCRFSQKFVDIL